MSDKIRKIAEDFLSRAKTLRAKAQELERNTEILKAQKARELAKYLEDMVAEMKQEVKEEGVES